MLRVGLTGGIGSGKSTVSSFIKQKGIPVIDADVISREVLTLYPEITRNIRAVFGDEFFDESGSLRRKEFGNYIFKDQLRVKQLEDIILPFIIKEVFMQLNEYEKYNERLCVVDAPTLIEANLHNKMDYNILVWADTETQIKRVIERDRISKEDVLGRINAQISLEHKKNLVDYVIDNSKSIEYTEEQIMKVLAEIERVKGEK